MRSVFCLLVTLVAFEVHAEGDRYADLYRCAKLMDPDMSPPHLADPHKPGTFFMLTPRNIVRYPCDWKSGVTKVPGPRTVSDLRPSEEQDVAMSRQHSVSDAVSGLDNLVVGCGKEQTKAGAEIWTYSVAPGSVEKDVQKTPVDIDNSDEVQTLMLGVVQKRLDTSIAFSRQYGSRDGRTAIPPEAFDICAKVKGLKNLRLAQEPGRRPIKVKAEAGDTGTSQ